MENGRGQPPGPGEEPDKPRGELATWTRIYGDQKSLDVGYETLSLELLTLEPRCLLGAHRKATQRPAQHRGHRHCRHHSHRNDRREEALVEDPYREPDRG